VSDSFLEPDTPLLMLISAAREGREKEVKNCFMLLRRIFVIYEIGVGDLMEVKYFFRFDVN
jgi:hypothetical protein